MCACLCSIGPHSALAGDVKSWPRFNFFCQTTMHIFVWALCIEPQWKTEICFSTRSSVILEALFHLPWCHGVWKRVLPGCDHFHPLVSVFKQSSLSPLNFYIYIYSSLYISQDPWCVILLITEWEGLRRARIKSQQQLSITGEGERQSEQEAERKRWQNKSERMAENYLHQERKKDQMTCTVR